MLHKLYGVKLGTGFIPSTELGYNANMGRQIQSVGGMIDPSFIAVTDSAPTMSFTTHAIAMALTAIGIDGAVATTEAPFVGSLIKRLDGGAFAAGGSHMTCTAAKALIVPKTLTASLKGLASLSYDAYLWSADGSTSPIVISVTASLAEDTDLDEAFGLGTVKINTTAIEVSSLTIDFGLTVDQTNHSGLLYPTHCGIVSRQPSITLSAVDPTMLNTLTQSGAAITSVVAYLRKYQKHNITYANTDTQHISFTVGAGNVGNDSFSASHPQNATNEITIIPAKGTNAVIVVATGVAIA